MSETRFVVVNWRVMLVVGAVAGIGVALLETLLMGVLAFSLTVVGSVLLGVLLLVKRGHDRHHREAERESEASRRRGLSEAERAVERGDQTTLHDYESE